MEGMNYSYERCRVAVIKKNWMCVNCWLLRMTGEFYQWWQQWQGKSHFKKTFAQLWLYVRLAKYTTTGLVCVPQGQMQRTKDFLLFTHVVVKTSDAVISHFCIADDHTGLFLSACRTSSTLFYLFQPIKYFVVDVALAARTFVQTNTICMRAKCQCNRNYFIQWRKSLIYFPLWSLFCLLPGNKDTYQGKCVLRLSLSTK